MEAAVNGTVVDRHLPSLTRVAEVPVGPHTADAALTPDGHALPVSRMEVDPQEDSALRLVEVPSGQGVVVGQGSSSP